MSKQPATSDIAAPQTQLSRLDEIQRLIHDFKNLLVPLKLLHDLPREKRRSNAERWIEVIAKNAPRFEALQEKMMLLATPSQAPPILPAAKIGIQLHKSTGSRSKKESVDHQSRIAARKLFSIYTRQLQQTFGDQLRCHLSGNLRVKLALNNELFFQKILLNAAKNTWEACKSNGREPDFFIHLFTAKQYQQHFSKNARIVKLNNSHWILVVSDLAGGISPTQTVHFFKRGNTTGKAKGTGIGTAEIYHSVIASAGKIKLFNTIGNGLAIHMAFPKTMPRHRKT